MMKFIAALAAVALLAGCSSVRPHSAAWNAGYKAGAAWGHGAGTPDECQGTLLDAPDTVDGYHIGTNGYGQWGLGFMSGCE